MANTYTPVLVDDFSRGYLTSNWGDPYGGGVYWNGAFSWSANDVAVRNGEMQVTMTHHDDGSWTAGGFSSFKAGKVITYGTIEFDARVEEAHGTQAAILTWPESDAWPDDGEIDILETPRDQSMYTLHWKGGDGSHKYDSQFSDIDASQQHHYKLTWLPDAMRIEVDGKVVAEWDDPNAIPDVPHGFGAMGYVGSGAGSDDWMGGAPDGSTPDKVTVHLDNVVMSQWTGGDGKPDPAPAPVPTPVPTPTPAPGSGHAPVVLEAGTGPDALVLKVSQQAYQGDAPYTVLVDGKQIGGTFTTSALHAEGKADTLTLHGDWGPGAHKVEVHFTDAFDAGADWSRPELVTADRNVFVESASFNGAAVPGAKLALYNETSANAFTFTDTTTPTPDPEPGPRPLFGGGDGLDTLTLDHVQGADVDGGKGADLIVLGADHGGVHLILDAGETRGDAVTGFKPGSDVLEFHGFTGGHVESLGDGDFKVYGADGKGETFFLDGVETLAATDYSFA